MKKVEVKVLVILLIIFLILFMLIPENKSELILANYENMSNQSSNESMYVDNDFESKVIIGQMKELNDSSINEVDNLSNKDNLVLGKEIEEKNKLFEKLNNISN